MCPSLSHCTTSIYCIFYFFFSSLTFLHSSPLSILARARLSIAQTAVMFQIKVRLWSHFDLKHSSAPHFSSNRFPIQQAEPQSHFRSAQSFFSTCSLCITGGWWELYRLLKHIASQLCNSCYANSLPWKLSKSNYHMRHNKSIIVTCSLTSFAKLHVKIVDKISFISKEKDGVLGINLAKP